MLSSGGLSGDSPSKIIVFMGNGMGFGQITADYYYNPQSPYPLFPVSGLVTTHPDGDKWVTDAAASSTALATGMKVPPGFVGMTPEGEHLTTVLDVAHRRGKRTGVIATTSITQPGPAAFTSHLQSWGREYEIAAQQAQTEVDVLLGGGLRFFESNAFADTNLISVMQSAGYEFVRTQSQLETMPTESMEKLLGLFALEALKQASMRSLSLRLMTRKAVEILDNDPDGFFLLVEGSQIDWRGHERSADGLVEELKDFGDAIRWALEYQNEHPELLIVVVGDHETGGVSLAEDANARGNVRIKFISGDHTANVCPLFAKGKGAHHFQGFLDIQDVGKKLLILSRSRTNQFLNRLFSRSDQ